MAQCDCKYVEMLREERERSAAMREVLSRQSDLVEDLRRTIDSKDMHIRSLNNQIADITSKLSYDPAKLERVKRKIYKHANRIEREIEDL